MVIISFLHYDTSKRRFDQLIGTATDMKFSLVNLPDSVVTSLADVWKIRRPFRLKIQDTNTVSQITHTFGNLHH